MSKQRQNQQIFFEFSIRTTYNFFSHCGPQPDDCLVGQACQTRYSTELFQKFTRWPPYAVYANGWLLMLLYDDDKVQLIFRFFENLQPFSRLTVQHGLRTPKQEIAFTARPKIQSQSQIFTYGRSISCLPHRPNFSDIFDLCLHWVSVVRGKNSKNIAKKNKSVMIWILPIFVAFVETQTLSLVER